MYLKLLKKKIRYFSLYFLNFSNFSFKNKVDKKEIIIVFDGKLPHGGFADRLKGILSFYNIAKLSEMEFKIYYTEPFKLNDFFEPNTVNWSASRNDLKWNFWSTKFIYLMDTFSFDWENEIKKSSKDKFIVYCNVDYLQALFPGKTIQEVNFIRSENFKNLFKQSFYLQTKLEEINLPESFIAIHTRFTSIFGDFKDTTSYVVSEIRKQQILKMLHDEIDIIAKKNSNKRILVFSDSIIFLDYIKLNTNYNILDGKPKHIDIKSNSDAESNVKNFIDFLAISKSDEIYLLQTKEMYNSGFSRYAAIIGNKKLNHIIIKN